MPDPADEMPGEMPSLESDERPLANELGGSAERYRWLSEINRGGVGVIRGARDPIIGRKVAIKVLRADLENDERVLGEFSQEARVTGQLDHPNIVPIYDFGDSGRGPYLVMKWIAGKTLAEVLRGERAPRQSLDRLRYLVQVLLRLCDALSFAHGRGVIHCDIKPENVMVGEHGQIYLMDWGMALVGSRRRAPSEAQAKAEPIAPGPPFDEDSLVRAEGQTIETGRARGTPAYMAPEQMFGLIDEIDERTDVFGLGGVLCEILVGEPPNNQRILIGSAGASRPWISPAHSPIWPQLPPELCRIASKALAPRRDDRYPSVAALRADLEQFLDGGGWFETQVFAAGQTIVTEGEGGDTAYIIESGHCEVYKLIDGREQRIRQLGPGTVFGEMAVFTGGTRTATVKAVDEVTVKLITGASLNLELDRNPWVAAFVRSLARRVRDSEDLASRPPR
ncbi:MAG TPA: serine/threonine-protein kinase [Polyangiaceae bacterium]|nr:serine/threonine-protein kinase [Polyangiaceae bacterium]